MSPAKIKQHEPTAVSRDPSDQKITEGGQTGTGSSQDAAEKARRSGMTKGTAGAAETGHKRNCRSLARILVYARSYSTTRNTLL
jgi:hypothetical protein